MSIQDVAAEEDPGFAGAGDDFDDLEGQWHTEL